MVKSALPVAVSLLLFSCAANGTAGDADLGANANPCAALAASPDLVRETQLMTAYPTPAGGTIVDGLYYLARFEIYSPANADAHTRRRLLKVDKGTLTSVNVNDEGPAAISGGTFTTSGSQLAIAITCPAPSAVALPYTATPDELWLFDTTEPNVQAYKRQP